MVIFGLADKDENVMRVVDNNGKYVITNDIDHAIYTTNTIEAARKVKNGLGVGNPALPLCPNDLSVGLKVVQLGVNVVATYEDKD